MTLFKWMRNALSGDPPTPQEDPAADVIDRLDRLQEQPMEWSGIPRAVAELAAPALCDWCLVTLEVGEDGERGTTQRLVAHPSPEHREVLERALQRNPLELSQRHLHGMVDEVLATGRPRTIRPTRDWSLRYYGANPSERYTLEQLDPRWIVSFPLASRGSTIGAITFVLVADSMEHAGQAMRSRFAGRAGLILDYARNIDQLEHARDDLRQVTHRVYSILDRDFSAVATVDRHWQLTYLNRSAEELLGLKRDRDTGRSMLQALPPKAMESPLWDLSLRALNHGQGGASRFVESWSGENRWVEVRAHPLGGGGAALYVRDITDEKEREERLKRHEEEMREAQKLESIGRLAGGVAHDFNNILMAINGHTELALRKIEEGHPSRDSLEEVRQSAQRAARLTRQLLTYSRKSTQQRRAVDFAAIVAALESSLLRLVGEDVHLIVRAAPDVPPVLADPNQLEQIVLNLAVNARDAMPRGGTIQIDIERRSRIEQDVDAPVDTPPDGWVLFSVRDSGTGIPADVMPHIFEPFFTTKSDRTGTGLGLSTVQGIVRQHGGAISVQSVEGRGSTMCIYLPACARTLAAARNATGQTAASAPMGLHASLPPIPPGPEAGTPDTGAAEAHGARAGNGAKKAAGAGSGRSKPASRTAKAAAAERRATILVAEDEAQVRQFIAATLEDEGYRVIPASNGAEALAVMKRHDGPVDLLLTDVVMPFMGGPELSIRLTKLDDRLRVVYMSGYAENVLNQNGDIPSGVVLLDKPFTASRLIEVIDDVLAGRVTAAPCLIG